MKAPAPKADSQVAERPLHTAGHHPWDRYLEIIMNSRPASDVASEDDAALTTGFD
jgi:hypothetical protein